MDKETKERLKKIPRTKCAKCGSKQHYTNPMAKCFECKKKYCFDHIWGIQVNNKMKENDELRNICDECKKKHGYRRA